MYTEYNKQLGASMPSSASDKKTPSSPPSKPEPNAPDLDQPGETMQDTTNVVANRDGLTVTANPRPHIKPRLIIALVLLIAVLVGVVVYLVLAKNDTTPVLKAPQAQVLKPKVSAPLPADLASFVAPKTGEVWDKTPQSVTSLGYFTDESTENPATYYKVGSLGSNTLYIGSLPEGGGPDTELFSKAPDGTVTVLLYVNGNEQPNADITSYAPQQYSNNVKIDTTTHLDSLTTPRSITLKNKVTLTLPSYVHIGTPVGDIPPIDAATTTSSTAATYGPVSVVKIERKYTDTGLTAINYELHSAAHTTFSYTYAPISTDLTSYTWNNGVVVTSTKDDTGKMSPIIRGCGAAIDAVSRADKVTDEDFVATGKTADGQTVYAFKDTSNALVTKAYGEYKDAFSDSTYTTVVPFADFLNNHGILAYKDSNGQWLVYTRNIYSAGGGCAKPVVYLYPTHTEAVTVQVGARVTVSDPYYDPLNGWTATARPNGQLTVGGKSYDSLFWEGQGNGAYPGITSGTVVKHSDAVATIANQLKQQGLTAKEANDFLAYWVPKIPNKPYVRLTWLTTAQLNTLAPLRISPRPDTLIRVFLDMDGFDTRISLPAQKLSSLPRKGFTVVEWGGLSQSVLK